MIEIPNWIIGYFINPIVITIGLIIFFKITTSLFKSICRKECIDNYII
jgi:hypothetical protein